MSTPAITPDKPIELTLGDGSVVKGATLEEAFNNLKSMKENASAAKKAAETERDNYRQQYEQMAAEVERLRTPTPKNDGKSFDKMHYYQLLNDDPIEAQDYIDRWRYDADPKQIRQRFSQIDQSVVRLEQSQAASQFLAQHAEDFPPDLEAAKVMERRMNELGLRGLPYNVDTLNYAYTTLVNEGQIKPNSRQDAQDDKPNPSLSGGGRSVEETELQKAETMSDADLEKFLRSKNMIR